MLQLPEGSKHLCRPTLFGQDCLGIDAEPMEASPPIGRPVQCPQHNSRVVEAPALVQDLPLEMDLLGSSRRFASSHVGSWNQLKVRQALE